MKSKTHWHEQLECKALSQVHALQPWSVIALAKFTSTASGDYECTLLRSPALDSSQVDPAFVLNWKRMRRAASIVRQTSRRCSRPHRRKCPFLSVHVYENTKWKLSASLVQCALCTRLALDIKRGATPLYFIMCIHSVSSFYFNFQSCGRVMLTAVLHRLLFEQISTFGNWACEPLKLCSWKFFPVVAWPAALAAQQSGVSVVIFYA